MPQVDINYLAVVVSAVINMALGFAWYGPLFGKPWRELSGWTKEKMDKAMEKGMNMTYGLSTVASLLIAYVLAHFVDYVQAGTVVEGMVLGFWAWLGFIATTMMNQVLYDGKPWKLYFINAGYYLVSLLMMGSVLALWQ